MPSSVRSRCLLLALAAAGLGGCPAQGPRAPSPLREALDAGEPVVLADKSELSTTAGARCAGTLAALDAAVIAPSGLTIDYPTDESVFPPGFVPPTFLWHDEHTESDAWLVHMEFAAGEAVLAVVPGASPEQGWIDRRAIGETNGIYEPTEYQASARTWTPSASLWEEIQTRSSGSVATITIRGFDTGDATHTVSSGAVRLSTSEDPVGAPIFYRDVPLMPSVSNVDGKIQPLAQDAMPLIEWRLRDVTRPESKLVLTGMRKCANCHSFSRDGKRMGMDVDGPTGDKGAYAMLPVEKQMVIDDSMVITWNSYDGRIEGTKTIGFLSRISPDGLFALTTLNESLYVANFANYKFLQVFYPTRGILAWASIETGEMKALPGADDTDYVHCSPAWLPDGESIVFARGTAYDPPMRLDQMARYPNDEREPKMLYDLYRMPFDGGRGGTPVAIQGASANGMSNTFPKVSPDGKWIVYTKCKNGQLLRPDGRLWIVPIDGGAAREMRCNLPVMNSWHSFSPNGRWLCFTSKSNTPYTQLFLTHIDEDGNDTPAILVPGCTAANRAVNLPEFLNASIEAIDDISVPVVDHFAFLAYFEQGTRLLDERHFEHAARLFGKAVALQPDELHSRVNLALSLRGSGEWASAMEQYEHALEIEPWNAFAAGALELLVDAREDAPPDVAARRTELAAAPGSVAAMRGLGIALARTGEPGDTGALLVQTLAAAPEDTAARRTLAYLLLSHGQESEAVAHLQQTLAREPSDVRARIVLSWLHAASANPQVRDPARAVQNARIACRDTEYQDPRATEALAAAYAAAGNTDDAVEIARLAIRLADRDRPSLARWARLRLALYERGGRPGD